MVEAGRVTAVIDGDIGPLKGALSQARSQATSAVSGIENDFKKGFGGGLQSSVSGLTSSMGPLGSAISGVSGGLGLVATAGLAGVAALGALGAASISTAANWESLMASVSKTTGVSGPALDTLSSDLQRIRTETGATAEEIANAVTVAGSVGIPADELAQFSEVALQMGSAFSMSSEAAVSGISAIGNSAKESGTSWTEFATRAGSSVNVLADSMRTSEEQILTGMTHLGATMGLLKPPQDTIPEWMAVVATVQSLGLAGDQAGEAIQDALTYAARDAKNAISGLLGISSQELQLNLRTNAPEVLQEAAKAIAALPLEQQAQAMAAFGATGSKAIALLMGDFDKTTGEFDKLSDAIDDSNSAWEEGTSLAKGYAASQSTFNSATSRLTATLDVAGQKLGTTFLPMLADGADFLTDMTKAAIATGEAVSGLVGSWNDWISRSVSDSASLETAYETANKGHWEMMAGDAVWIEDAVADAVESGTEEGMEKGADAANPALKKSVTEAVEDGVNDSFDAAKDALKKLGVSEELAGQMAAFGYTETQALAAINAQTSSTFSGYGGAFGRGSGGSGTRVTTVNGVEVGLQFQNDKNRTRATLFIDGQEVAGPVYGSDPDEMLRQLFSEPGLAYDTGNVLDLQGKTGEAAIWRERAKIVVDSYYDFSEDLTNEIEEAGIEIGEAFAAGMVPDIAHIDTRLDAIRRLKLYDPDEYERQGAEGAEEYLISLQSALDAYEAAKIAYIAEPDENTLSDFEKTFDQLQGLADNMPVTLKLKADDEEFIKVLTAYYKNGGNVDWNSLGVSNPQRYLEYAKKQLSSEVSTYAEQGKTVPEGETLNFFYALQNWFQQNSATLDATNRTSSALLDQALSKGGLYWDQLYAHMGLLSTEVSSSGKSVKQDVAQAGTGFVQQVGSSTTPIFRATDHFEIKTDEFGNKIATIGSNVQSGGQVGGSAMASGGQTGGQAIANACATGAGYLIDAASGLKYNALSDLAASSGVAANVYPLTTVASSQTSSQAAKALVKGPWSESSDLAQWGSVPAGWKSSMDEAKDSTTGATESTDSLCASTTSLQSGARSASSGISVLANSLYQLPSVFASVANSFYPLAGVSNASANLQQSAYDTSEALSHTAESMDNWCEAASDFAYWQESNSDLLFQKSYIGPTASYSSSQTSASSSYQLPAVFGTDQQFYDAFGWYPSFADEGYVASPTLAMVGDRPGGEYVVGAARFENAVAKMGNGQTINVDYHPIIQGSGLSADELAAVIERDRKSLIAEIAAASSGL